MLAWLYHVNHGIFMTPGVDEQWTLSVAHTDEQLQRYVDAFGFGPALVAQSARLSRPSIAASPVAPIGRHARDAMMACRHVERSTSIRA